MFLEGNGLPGAWLWRDEFVVSELGLGTGLNLLALVTLLEAERALSRPVPRLIYQSVEWQPRPSQDILALAEKWPDLTPASDQLLRVYQPMPGWNRWAWPWGDIVLYVGDARLLPSSNPTFASTDAWFLDGFAPDRNPELWDVSLLRWVGERTRAGGTAATYSAAGIVKQGLREAGFTVARAPGWGRKRHMVRARR